MTPASKKIILRLLSNGRGDDLYRAELAFRNCTSEQMDQHYGQSGQTRREILNGYKKRDEEIDVAVAEVNALP